MSIHLSRRPVSRRAVVVAVASTLGFSAMAAEAATFTKADNNSQLNQAASYVGPPAAAPTATDVILWDSTLATPANGTVGVGGNYIVGGLQVTNPSGPITITSGSIGGSPTTSVFTIGASGIDMSAATQDLTINTTTLRLGPGTAATNPFVVAADRTLTVGGNISVQGGTHTLNVSGAGNYVFNGPVTGSGGSLIANFNSTGTVTFGGANAFASSVALNSGTFIVNNDAGLNGGRLDLGNVTIRSTTGFSSTMGARLLGNVTVDGSSNIAFGGELFNRNGSRTITNNITGPAQLTLANLRISDTGGIVRVLTLNGTGNTVVNGTIIDGVALNAGSGLSKSGTGSVTLAGTNTYTGVTNISNGTLVTANAAAFGTSAVNVTSTGALKLGNGTANTVGGLTGLTMADGTTLELGAAASKAALASGAFALGNINLDLNNLFNAVGNYTIIDGVDGANAIGTTTFVDADTTNYSYAFNVVGNDAVLSVTAAATPEPATLATLGLVGLLALKRRRSI